jgi:predicted nuclease with RNAse H fold
MSIRYLGVDIAGASNTWVAALTPNTQGAPEVCLEPAIRRLVDIRDYCSSNHVVAVAIDAQLTMSIADGTGFRPSDNRLRALLPKQFQGWVASLNSLMAVPVRGQLLAETLSPLVGTILETHPRACLYAALAGDQTSDLAGYKSGPNAPQAASRLCAAWLETFGISSCPPVRSDGALDAIICATVAYQFHRAPESLLHLRNPIRESVGRGPFYVTARHDWFDAEELASNVPPSRSNDVLKADSPLDSMASQSSAGRGIEPIRDASAGEYAQLRGKRVMCPACAQHEFANWPWGWDAHAAHVCAGIDGTSPSLRKDAYRTRFAHLLPKRRR